MADKTKKTVAVGMSGGVDSSVSALLLKQQGYNVIGIFMKNWNEKDSECTSQNDYQDVLEVCEKINIPLYTFNFTEEYHELVFKQFLDEYKQGYTPNPDILCNREIKFNVFLEKAKEIGADFLATGHYAQIKDNKLLKGKDPKKDQSYFLYTLKNEILKNVIFPIGHLLKSDVKQIAKENNFSNYEKKESMGICFIGKRKFKPFLSSYIGFSCGDFEDLEGNIVGKHDGTAFYTLGQRKGLKIGGKGDAWYVVKKDIERNVVVVAQGKDNPSLFSQKLFANELSWVEKEPSLPFSCRAKVRYRQKEEDCIIEKIENNVAYVTFKNKQRSVTPRQSIVFYKEDICLGGGMIITSE